jgi:hypothetical protein
MAFGTGAVTAAVAGGLASGAIGVGGSALLGGLGGGGGGGSKKAAKQIKKALKEHAASTARTARELIASTERITRELMAKVESAGGNYRNLSQGERDAFLARITDAADAYRETVNVVDDALPDQVSGALDALEGMVDAINEGSLDDTAAELQRFAAANVELDTRLNDESEESLAKFEATVGDKLEEYSTSAREEINATQEASMSLGDTFMQRSNAALDRFSGIAGQSPEFLNQSVAAADQLSKAALQTRMDLLATADPRALELSAIADENAAAMMSGRIGADVQANLARSGAMRALQGGFGGGGEMGRNLQARDLGLTSLDLMRQGAAMNDAQRRLNYDTRVAGTQVNPFEVMQERRQAETELLRNTLSTAESDRNQRLNTLDTASTRRLGVLDTSFKTGLGTAETRLGRETANIDTRYRTGLAQNNTILGTSLAAQGAATDRSMQLANTIFGARAGVIENTRNSQLGLAGTIFGTTANAADRIYTTQTGVESDIFRGTAAAAGQGAQMQGASAANAAQLVFNASQSQAATLSNLAMQRMANQQATQASNNQMWGSIISSGASLAGAALGSYAGGGSGTGSIFGSLFNNRSNYQNLYGPATGGNTGLTTPAGWGNFSSGSGPGGS